MKKPLFVVPVADLESGEKHRQWEIPVDWLASVLEATDATPRGRPGELEVDIGLSGREVIVRGHVRAELSMPCARTLDPVDVDVDTDLFLLLVPAAPPPAPRRRPGRRAEDNPKKRPAGPEQEGTLSAEDAARDTYDGEQVVLDGFVREFIQLDLPMVALRSDLRSDESASISAPPGVADRAKEPEAALDPRLAPLAEIARRLRDKE